MKKICAFVLLAAGLLAIILGCVCFGKDDGSWERSYTYGGDAYTGIQNAAAQTANNVQALADINRFGFGAVLLVGGIALTGAGLGKLESEKATAVPQIAEPEPMSESAPTTVLKPEDETKAEE